MLNVQVTKGGLDVSLKVPESKPTQELPPHVLYGTTQGICPCKTEYIIHNGHETELYCKECLKDAVLDLIRSNNIVVFTKIGEKEWEL